jgi:integrase
MRGHRNRRPHGTGNVFEKGDRWYGQWYVRGKRTKKSLGPIRKPGSREGLTRAMAEARLRELIAATDRPPTPVTERMTLQDAGTRRIRELARKGRKQDTTLANYESEIRCHFQPHFGSSAITDITDEDVEEFIDDCLERLSVKSVQHLYVHLNAIFEFAIRKHWCHANPCKEVDKPASPDDDDREIRFLDHAELDALLSGPPPCRHSKRTLERAERARKLRDHQRLEWKSIAAELGCSPATAIYLYRATADAALDEDLWRVDLTLYLTAAMTGLRQGELLGLRWRDIDWSAQRIRVSGGMRNGKRRTPKSVRSSRAVPMADRVGGALDVLYKNSAYQGDDDLVFGHPHTGKPLDRSQVSKRFKRALERAAVRQVRFHDLRHTFGTRMAASGVPIRTLQAWMGHADIKTTMIYTHYAPAPNEVELVNWGFSSGRRNAAADPVPTAPNPKGEQPD